MTPTTLNTSPSPLSTGAAAHAATPAELSQGYGPAPGCGSGCLPRPGTVPGVGPLRRFARYTGMLALLLAAVGLAAALPVLRGTARHRAVSGWFRALLAAAGVRLVVRGAPARDVSLVVANHVSWLDIPAMVAAGMGTRVVGKSDVRGWPVIGTMAARGGTIFIDRIRLRRLPGTVAEVTTALRAGQTVVAFPEGSTWCGRTSGRFYPALFQAAVDADVPVLPVTLTYRLATAPPPPEPDASPAEADASPAWADAAPAAAGAQTTVAAFVGDDSLIASVRRIVGARGLSVEVTTHRPIAPTHGCDARTARRGGAARRALAAAAHAHTTARQTTAASVPPSHRRPVVHGGEGNP